MQTFSLLYQRYDFLYACMLGFFLLSLHDVGVVFTLFAFRQRFVGLIWTCIIDQCLLQHLFQQEFCWLFGFGLLAVTGSLDSFLYLCFYLHVVDLCYGYKTPLTQRLRLPFRSID